MIFWCPVCKETRDNEDIDKVHNKLIGYIEFCVTCGSEVVQATNCPYHGTSALDEMGECAKC